MVSASFDLDNAIKEPESISVNLWRYNDFEINKKYEIILRNFPKRKEKIVNDRTVYYSFKGEIFKMKCASIEFSKINFDDAFIKCEDRKKLVHGKDTKIVMVRKTKKTLCFLSMSLVD